MISGGTFGTVSGHSQGDLGGDSGAGAGAGESFCPADRHLENKELSLYDFMMSVQDTMQDHDDKKDI